jgi:hypothetical protein
MSIVIIVAFILIIVVVIIIIAYYGSSWKPATLNQTVLNSAASAYNIPSAWSGAQSVKGSTCQAYTFLSINGIIPQPSIDELNLGDTTIQPINSTCTDDDQIFAQKMYHICKYGEFQDIPPAQFAGCQKVDGSHTKVDGFYEEFFNICGPPISNNKVGTGTFSDVTSDTSTRCPGSIGLVMFNFQASLDGGLCLREPVYTIDGTNIIIDPQATLTIAKKGNGIPTGTYPDPSLGCNFAETQHNFPAQIFRVSRHTYSNGVFTLDGSGSWINIIHRPTGKYVAPYTLTQDLSKALVTSFIPNNSPILIDGSSFNGKGNWWYMSNYIVMPNSLIRGVRPDPDPMIPSTIVGSPTWDGLYWADQQRAAKPQLIWAPDPTVISNATTDEALWALYTSTTNIIYSLVPFVRTNNDGDYSRMSMTPFITYSLASGFPIVDAIPPITDPTSPFYANMGDALVYAGDNANNPSSACLGFNTAAGGRYISAPGTITGYIFVPLYTGDPCYKEYVNNLTILYNEAVAAAKERVLAENGAFQYLDLVLYPTILNNVGSYFKTG